MTNCILLVDDNPLIHEDYRKILGLESGDGLAQFEAELFGAPDSGAGQPAAMPQYELSSAYQGEEALKLVVESVQSGKRFQVAFVDVRMPPGWNGIETIQRLWEVDPELEIVICTAYSDCTWQDISRQLGQSGRYLILKKPFEGIEARQMAATLTTKHALLQYQQVQLQELERTAATRLADLNLAQDQRAAAEEGSRTKSEFLANMSHEIRTPLNGIVGMMELLRTTRLDEDQNRFVNIGLRSASCLTVLINDILDLSKIEAGRIELESIDFDLHQLLVETMELMTPQAQKKGLQTNCCLQTGLPKMAKGDLVRLRQILINLIGNAIKFTAEGQVELRASFDGSNAESPDHPAQYRFEVVDSGIGIPDDRLDRLFQVFSQVDASTTREYGGTGLGLAISKRLAEALGGNIGVESQSGIGSTFWFTANLLPATTTSTSNSALQESGQIQNAFGSSPMVNPELANNQTNRPDLDQRNGVSDIPSSSLRQARLLVAEDNEINRHVIHELFTRNGWDCEMVENGRQGVDQASTRQFDLMLMDCQMPVLDGLESTREIRERESAEGGWGRDGKRLPIVALTANAISGVRKSCMKAGMDGYLTKPVDLASLTRVIHSLMGPDSPYGFEVNGLKSTANREPSEQAANRIESFDASDFLERCFGDTQIANELLDMFAASAPDNLADLDLAILESDLPRLASLAHSLKGIAGILSARPLLKLTTLIGRDQHDSSGDHSQLIAQARQLRDEVQRCIEYLPALRAELSTKQFSETGA